MTNLQKVIEESFEKFDEEFVITEEGEQKLVKWTSPSGEDVTVSKLKSSIRSELERQRKELIGEIREGLQGYFADYDSYSHDGLSKLISEVLSLPSLQLPEDNK